MALNLLFVIRPTLGTRKHAVKKSALHPELTRNFTFELVTNFVPRVGHFCQNWREIWKPQFEPAVISRPVRTFRKTELSLKALNKVIWLHRGRSCNR